MSGKSDADKAGAKRMKAYEARKKVVEPSDDEYIFVAYQKIEPGEWERVEVKRKKKL